MDTLRRNASAFALSVWLSACGGTSETGGPPPPPPLPDSPYRIDVLSLGGRQELEEIPAKALRDGMRLFRFTEPDHYNLEVVDLGGDLDALPGTLEESARRGADLIVLTHPHAALAARSVEVRQPVVLGFLGDPTALGLDKSGNRQRPGWTGAFHALPAYGVLALVKSCLPQAGRVGVVFNGRDPLSVAHKEGLIRDSARAGLEVVAVETDGAEGLGDVLDDLLGGSIDAVCLVVGLGPSTGQMIESARRAKVPVFGFSEGHVQAGALAAEVPDVERVGVETGRIIYRALSGEGTEGLTPTQMIDSYTVVNPSTAADLAIELPASVLRNARIHENPDTVHVK